MKECIICGKGRAANILEICVDCLRKGKGREKVREIHREVLSKYDRPYFPKGDGIPCNLCANECIVSRLGMCGVREVKDGKLVPSGEYGYLDWYLDPLPTNCCNTWFCPAGTGAGYPKFAYKNGPEYGYFNLAVFFYGCNFDCLFCQNSEHKRVPRRKKYTPEELANIALENDKISCVCYFGGSPEPQLPYAIKASRIMVEGAKEKGKILRICWEMNGAGNPALMRKVAELSLVSGGNIKFDLKAYSEDVAYALTGTSNKRTFDNFKMIFEEFWNERKDLPIIGATTLLVPYYVDAYEVENIAKFLASLSPDIPYSLLVFHPDFLMKDLPITPVRQVRECFEAAKKYLKNVNIGNKFLIALADVFSKDKTRKFLL